MTPPRPHFTLAARMGRWSAAHWKTATFGWLALVFVAFGIGGAIGTKNLDPPPAGPGAAARDGGPGRVGRHVQAPRGRLQAARARGCPDSEHVAPGGRSRLRGGGRGR